MRKINHIDCYENYPRLWVIVSTFSLGFILFFRVNPQIIPNIQVFLSPLIEPFIESAGSWLFESELHNTKLLSDTKALYTFVLTLVVFCSMFGVLMKKKWLSKINPNMRYWVMVIFRYYLAYLLLHYGFNKVFKWQFFMPEPNIAYRELGQITPDLLYWSAVGSSYSYTVIAGLIELIAAGLLLFRKTTKLGALLAVVLFSNIVLVNFSFNISVKVFSLFLLALSLFILSPTIKQIISLLINETVNQNKPDKINANRKTWLYVSTKSTIVLIFIIDALWIYGKSGNWNDDTFRRNEIHGAYQVLASTHENVTRLFVNRKGYLITEHKDKTRKDYNLSIDTSNKHLVLQRLDSTTNWVYEWDDSSNLILKSSKPLQYYKLKKLPYKELPLFNDQFNWWID